MVLVGTNYNHMNNSWSQWDDKPFEEVCAEVEARHRDRKVSSLPSEIVEVIIVRRAVVEATILVREDDIGDTGVDDDSRS